MSSEYNKEHLFGSDRFIEELKGQADMFMSEVKKSGSFDGARFAKLDVYRYDCEARFYWGEGEGSRYVIVVLGSEPAIQLQRNNNRNYDIDCIDALKEIAEKLDWEFM